MDKQTLMKELCVMEKKVEKAKERRALETIIGFAAAFFLLIYITEKPTGIAILGELVAAFVLAGLHFVINGAVFGALALRNEAERRELERLRKELSEQTH